MLRALSDGVSWLEQKLGSDMEAWTWGELHQATFVSQPLGLSGIGLIEALVNRGPFPADGGNGIVNAIGWSQSEPAAVTWHPSMRMIVDLSDLDASLSVIPTGQSGHPYHQHYDDEIPLWLEGEYHAMLFSRQAVETAAEDVLTLEPER